MINLEVTSYKNAYQVNRAIEQLIESKNFDTTNLDSKEIEFMLYYSGYGGLEKQGTFSETELKGLLYEFYTPDEVVKRMWGLAYKYGYGNIGDNSVFEPSVGTGNFIKYAPKDVYVSGNEINKYSQYICSACFPFANITLQPFEKNFISKNNDSIKGKIDNLQKYSLVIGNPPYGELNSIYVGMGENKYTHASNFTEYFITRGLDLLVKDGLLIYVVGAEQKNGGTLFLDSANNKCKQIINDKAYLLDAYRLPTNIFERTKVSSEIVVFKKK
jgi:type I restriction-modification system DNA methylase subunit